MKKNRTTPLILITVILMDLLVGMEFDLFVPSFPELQRQFNLSPFWVEALVSVNFIGYCLSLFFVGSLADRYGRKPIITVGLILFILGSVFCLWGGTYNFLLFGRFIQGAGIAAPAILSFLIIADAYTLKQQQFYLAMLNGLMNTSVALSPVLGSYITLYFHWEGNFWALLLLGIIVFVMTEFFIKNTKHSVSEATATEQTYLTLFKSKPLLQLMLLIIFMFTPYWIFVGMSPLLYINDLHISLSHFGYYQGALALVFAVGSILFGFIVGRFNSQYMLRLSLGIYSLGLIILGWVTFTDSHYPLVITLAILPFVIGEIIPTTLLYPVCLNLIPGTKGRVAAILQAGRLLLSALALQLAGWVYQGSFQNIGIILSAVLLLVIINLAVYVIRNDASRLCNSPNKV
jgi:DHA1 family bicyclomycin/chloramphenicol resistance-like MFS transporter